jgi:hypothetical protein
MRPEVAGGGEPRIPEREAAEVPPSLRRLLALIAPSIALARFFYRRLACRAMPRVCANDSARSARVVVFEPTVSRLGDASEMVEGPLVLEFILVGSRCFMRLVKTQSGLNRPIFHADFARLGLTN